MPQASYVQYDLELERAERGVGLKAPAQSLGLA